MIYIDEKSVQDVPVMPNHCRTSLSTIPSKPLSKQEIEFQMAVARKNYLTDRLRNNFPDYLGAAFSILMLIFGLAAIVLQGMLIHIKAPYFEICQGIWGGIACFVVSISNSVIMANRSHSAFNLGIAVIFVCIPAIALTPSITIWVLQEHSGMYPGWTYHDHPFSEAMIEQINDIDLIMFFVGFISATPPLFYPFVLKKFLMHGFKSDEVSNKIAPIPAAEPPVG